MGNILDTMLLPILDGSKITLAIFFITLILSIPLGFIAALGHMSKFRPLCTIVGLYIWVMRGTPLMLQLLFVYYVLPFFNIMLPDVVAALVAFVLNYAAYFAEIFRAGIQSIDKGQYEAAAMLGMSPFQTMLRIILPQMVKRVIPPVGNETINLVKDTSLCSVLAMNDLLRTSRSM